MVEKEVIIPKDGAPPAGPYSPAIKIGNFIFISGQIPINPNTGKIEVKNDIKEQTRVCLDNIGKILSSLDLSYDNIVKVTVFLKNINDFASMNEVYREYFNKKPPARSCVEVSNIPLGALIEIEAIAFYK